MPKEQFMPFYSHRDHNHLPSQQYSDSADEHSGQDDHEIHQSHARSSRRPDIGQKCIAKLPHEEEACLYSPGTECGLAGTPTTKKTIAPVSHRLYDTSRIAPTRTASAFTCSDTARSHQQRQRLGPMAEPEIGRSRSTRAVSGVSQDLHRDVSRRSALCYAPGLADGFSGSLQTRVASAYSDMRRLWGVDGKIASPASTCTWQDLACTEQDLQNAMESLTYEDDCSEPAKNQSTRTIDQEAEEDVHKWRKRSEDTGKKIIETEKALGMQSWSQVPI